MIVSINQPAYIPWPGYFDRIAKSDVHIVLDHVQFEKNSLTNRNKVKTPQGWSWLTVPVKTKGKFKDCPISALETNDAIPWAKKHLKTIISYYAKAPFYERYKDFFEEVYNQDWPLLFPLIDKMNRYILDELAIKTEILYSSDLNPSQTKSELVLELCQKAGAKHYISGPFGRDYLDLDSFGKNNIEVLFHDYQPQPYTQLYGEFEPFMSVIDLLFNHGPESFDILQNSAESLKRQ